MTFDKLDRKACRILRDAINKALADLDYGVQCTVGGMTYEHSGQNITAKLEISLLDGDGTANTRERQDFTSRATMYGLKPEHLDCTFRDGGHTYTIMGCKPRSRKYPILVERDDGKIYKFPAGRVAAYMK